MGSQGCHKKSLCDISSVTFHSLQFLGRRDCGKLLMEGEGLSKPVCCAGLGKQPQVSRRSPGRLSCRKNKVQNRREPLESHTLTFPFPAGMRMKPLPQIPGMERQLCTVLIKAVSNEGATLSTPALPYRDKDLPRSLPCCCYSTIPHLWRLLQPRDNVGRAVQNPGLCLG